MSRQEHDPRRPPAAVRYVYVAVGWLFVALGVAGIFLPLLPTTPFLLLALWAFSRSSPRLNRWLIEHPRLGPYVQDGQRYRIVPLKAKLASVSMMTASFLWMAFATDAPGWALAVAFVLLAPVAAWIATRPQRPRAARPHAPE